MRLELYTNDESTVLRQRVASFFVQDCRILCMSAGRRFTGHTEFYMRSGLSDEYRDTCFFECLIQRHDLQSAYSAVDDGRNTEGFTSREISGKHILFKRITDLVYRYQPYAEHHRDWILIPRNLLLKALLHLDTVFDGPQDVFSAPRANAKVEVFTETDPQACAKIPADSSKPT